MKKINPSTLRGSLMERVFTEDVDGIKVSEFTDNFWQQARARDETVNPFDCKCSGKDGKAFWFLVGYRAGKTDFSESIAGHNDQMENREV